MSHRRTSLTVAATAALLCPLVIWLGTRLIGGPVGSSGEDPAPYIPVLVTNEYAYRHPSAPDAVLSPDWVVTSGSLFAVGGELWTGLPDPGSPGPSSSNATGSAVFRAVTVRQDHLDGTVAFDLRHVGYTTTSRTPAQNWDGMHVFLRYQSPEATYYASVLRRDGRVVIKKKTAGGTINGGTYATLAITRPAVPSPAFPLLRVEVSVRTLPGPIPAVQIAISLDGRLVLTAVDDGRDGRPPITAPGRTGVRGDNSEFYIRNYAATPLPEPSPSPSDLPSELPSDVPSELPSELPSDLPSELPSDPVPSVSGSAP